MRYSSDGDVFRSSFFEDWQIEGYLINDDVEKLSQREYNLFISCVYIVDRKMSLRRTAREFGISKSSIHEFANKKLSTISRELYKCVKRQLKDNFIHAIRFKGRVY